MVKIELHPGVLQDIKNLKIGRIEFGSIQDKIILCCREYDILTSRIRGFSSDFRKIKYNDKRIFIWVNKDVYYILKISHRKNAYSEKNLGELLNLIRDYTG